MIRFTSAAKFQTYTVYLQLYAHTIRTAVIIDREADIHTALGLICRHAR